MRSLGTKAVADGGRAAALVAVLALVAAFVPLASMLALPLMPLPIGYVAYRHPALVSVCATIAAAGVGAAAAGPVAGLSTVLLAGGAGMVYGAGLRRGFGFSRLFLSVAGAAAVAVAVSATVVWFVAGMTMEQLQLLLEEAVAAGAAMSGASGVEAESVLGGFNEWLRVLPYMLPGLFGMAGVFIAGAMIGLGGAIFRRMGLTLAHTEFAAFRLHWSLAYGLIGGLALLLFAPRFGQGEFVLRVLGLNLMLIFQSLFLFQGLAVVRWLTISRRMSQGGTFLLFALMLVGQLFIQLASWVGLLDTWLDIRRRAARRNNDDAHVTPGQAPGGRDGEEG